MTLKAPPMPRSSAHRHTGPIARPAGVLRIHGIARGGSDPLNVPPTLPYAGLPLQIG
ncbi:hypothetical protein SAMN04489713_104329 [Actinomadura madurae]|uniref:Uncharacterized protein n=1 Tax=Actinomadura madurae TaxID=1993 RepID=A0A1I5EXC6_9ACTN|nr:hypothetical protein SAMN04489713_104329 [Actinomadura madurae]SPT60119.1 Uncharacterised protein [Actinomadura madurae]